MFMMPRAKQVVRENDVLFRHFGEHFHELIVESPDNQRLVRLAVPSARHDYRMPSRCWSGFVRTAEACLRVRSL